MSPQVSENLCAEIYVETDDLLKAFHERSRTNAPGRFLLCRRTPRLSASGIAALLVGYHLSGYKCLVINPPGQHTADHHHAVLTHLLCGLCAGDKAYWSTLFEPFYATGLHLPVRPKRNLKALRAFADQVRFLNQQPLLEPVNDILSTVCDLEHTRHRNPLHGYANILSLP